MILELAIGTALLCMVVFAIVKMMRHRGQMRAAGREAEKLNVISNDKRRSFWSSAADTSDSSDAGGGDSGGDGGGGSD